MKNTPNEQDDLISGELIFIVALFSAALLWALSQGWTFSEFLVG